MRSALVICIGNEARGDDGVAREVAREVEWRLRGEHDVRVLSETALDPGMAEAISERDLVVFVDAERRDDPLVRTTPVAPGATGGAWAHALTPGAVLGLAGSLYGHAPDAVLISLAAPEMEHEQGLSDTARGARTAGTEAVLDAIR